MKRFLLLWVSMFLMAGVNAQCIPNPAYTSSGIYPDTLTNLPVVNVGVSYNGVITAVVPADTVISGLTANIDSITVTEIVGLPAGFNWTGIPAGGSVPVSIPGGTAGCLSITGTATAGQVGTHPLLIKIVSYGRLMGMPLTIPDTIRGYKLVIGAVGMGENANYSFGVTEMYPNPAANEANIVVSNNETATVLVNITDMIGRTVAASSHKINAGETTIQLNVANLNEGVYSYTVSKGNSAITRKLIINR